MAKRVADNYLTHDNWDKEDKQEEEAGVFQQANDEVMKQRKIKKARRRAPLESKEQNTGGAAFANFGGLKANVTKAVDVKSQFSFLTSNGNKPAQTAKTEEPKDKKEIETPQHTVVNSEYNRQLSALNKSVSDWISKHVSANPVCNLTPVFRDYKKHLNQIEDKYLSSQSDSSPSSQETSKSETSFKLTGFGTKTSIPLKTETKIEQPTIAPLEKPKFSGFSTTTSSAFTGFSFAGQNKPNNSGFKFGDSMVSDPKSTKADSTTPKQEEKADEEYKPPIVESTSIQEEGSFYTKRCKLFYKKDDSYCERGVGNIHLKKVEDKTQLVIRADTSLGNILLNIILQSELPTQRLGKNNVMITCVPNPPIDPKNDQKVAVMLIRVKSGEDADELLKLIDENKV